MRKYLYLVVILFLLFLMVGCVPETEEGNLPGFTSISPASGTRGETLDATITGAYLSDVTSLYFGPDVAIQVNNFEVISSSEIHANIHISGTATLGPKDISLINPYGTTKINKSFLVAGSPDITSVTPATGAQGVAMDVTIQGEGFYGVTGVQFGSGFPDIDTDDFQIVTEYAPVTIIATINIDPELTPGAVDVTVYTNHGTAIGGNIFTVIAKPSGPVVSSVTPDGWIVGSTITVSIKGIGFSDTPAPVVSFGPDIVVNWVHPVDPGEIEVNITIPSDATLGYRDVSVTSFGLTGVGENLFYVYTLI